MIGLINCTFNLFETTILRVNKFNIRIRLEDIQINLFQVGPNFIFKGSNNDVYVKNLLIMF